MIFHRCKGTLLPPEQYCVSNNNITQGLCVWWTFKWISIMCETYCFVTLQFSRTSETIGNSEQSFPVISRQQCVCVWYVRYRLQDIRRIMLTHINTVKCHSPCSLCVGPGPSTVLTDFLVLYMSPGLDCKNDSMYLVNTSTSQGYTTILCYLWHLCDTWAHVFISKHQPHRHEPMYLLASTSPTENTSNAILLWHGSCSYLGHPVW